jgi:hypothetical protein
LKKIFRLFVIVVVLGLVAGIFLMVRRSRSSDQPVATFTFPYVQNFDDVNLRPWYINGGVWTIRDQALLQTVPCCKQWVGKNQRKFTFPSRCPKINHTI